MKIIIVNGYPQSGKDAFVDLCLEIMGAYARKRSTVDIVKEMAKIAGWNGKKSPENRKLLSDIKDLISAWNDVPFKYIKNQIRLFKSYFESYDMTDDNAALFVFSREPEEIQRFKDELGAVTVFINRRVNEPYLSNHADMNVENFNYDYYVFNNQGIKELKETAKEFLEKVGLYVRNN